MTARFAQVQARKVLAIRHTTRTPFMRRVIARTRAQEAICETIGHDWRCDGTRPNVQYCADCGAQQESA